MIKLKYDVQYNMTGTNMATHFSSRIYRTYLTIHLGKTVKDMVIEEENATYLDSNQEFSFRTNIKNNDDFILVTNFSLITLLMSDDDIQIMLAINLIKANNLQNVKN